MCGEESRVSPAEPELPRWLRIAYVLWFVPWLLVYGNYFGWQCLLWFCCLANVYVLIGCITQRSLWFSLASIAALGIQLVYTLDFVALCATKVSPTGATSYMLDAARPLGLRALSLFHVWMPLLLLYATRKLGYDARAFWIQTLVALCLLPIGYFAFDPQLDTNDAVMPRVLGLPFDRDFNINWVHAFYDRPEPAVGSRRLWTMLLGYPIAVHLPTHLLLSWWRGAHTQR
jgi:hypothetical protein